MKKYKKSTILLIIKAMSGLILLFLLSGLINSYVTLKACSHIELDNYGTDIYGWVADIERCERLQSSLWIVIVSFIIIIVETIMLFIRQKWAFGFGIFAYVVPLLSFGFYTPQFLFSLACLILVIVIRKELKGD